MQRREIERLDRELGRFLDGLVDGMGRPERRRAMAWYVIGLLLDGDRKSMEPMAARLVRDPKEREAMRQRLQECVNISGWSDGELRRRLALKLKSEMPVLEAFVVDDTGFPKKGTHSVGVARQYAGCLGRTDNCQVATSLHVAGEQGSACIAMQLYVPEAWANDPERRAEVGIPDEVDFKTKWQIAVDQIDDAVRWGVRMDLVLADAGYGDAVEFRDAIVARGLDYVVGVTSTAVVWPPGVSPQPPPPRLPGRGGHPRTRYVDGDASPMTLAALAKSRGRDACRVVTWRQGTRGPQKSTFGRVRVRTAHKHRQGQPPGQEQWLLYEWPEDEKEPTKYWLSTLGPNTSWKELVRRAKLRWRVERDYEEMKDELGLDHYEGRGWRGFHHHVTLCMLAHAFLALRRALFPPEPSALDRADGSAGTAANPR